MYKTIEGSSHMTIHSETVAAAAKMGFEISAKAGGIYHLTYPRKDNSPYFEIEDAESGGSPGKLDEKAVLIIYDAEDFHSYSSYSFHSVEDALIATSNEFFRAIALLKMQQDFMTVDPKRAEELERYNKLHYDNIHAARLLKNWGDLLNQLHDQVFPSQFGCKHEGLTCPDRLSKNNIIGIEILPKFPRYLLAKYIESVPVYDSATAKVNQKDIAQLFQNHGYALKFDPDNYPRSVEPIFTEWDEENDLFDNYDNNDEALGYLRHVISSHERFFEDGKKSEACKRLLNETIKLGYIFDYGLSYDPMFLKKLDSMDSVDLLNHPYLLPVSLVTMVDNIQLENAEDSVLVANNAGYSYKLATVDGKIMVTDLRPKNELISSYMKHDGLDADDVVDGQLNNEDVSSGPSHSMG